MVERALITRGTRRAVGNESVNTEIISFGHYQFLESVFVHCPTFPFVFFSFFFSLFLSCSFCVAISLAIFSFCFRYFFFLFISFFFLLYQYLFWKHLLFSKYTTLVMSLGVTPTLIQDLFPKQFQSSSVP